jgi:putative cell wall-binding protein
MDRSVPGEGSSVHRRATMLVIAAAVVLAVVPASASAWVDDFFDGRASGQAVYEDMAIGPEAVRVGASVYCVYQGMGLDAYIIAFDDSGAIRGPFLVGHNPLSAGTDPDDSHGAPALLHDPVTGDLHVFWGSHTSPLQHAKTRTPGDITSWVPAASIPGNTSYAQVLRDDEGIVHLFYRLDDNSGAMVDGAPVMDRQGWWHATSADGGNTWGAPKPVVNGTPEVRWYAHFEKGPGGAIHVAMTPHLRKDPSPLARTGLFYARLDPDTGSWMNAAGSEIATPGAPIPAEACLEGSSGLTVSPVGAERQNGMSIAIDGSGDAVLVYVAGGEYGPGACRWESARFNGSRWVTTTITATDFLMDSGAVEYAADGTLEAFLTVGAGPAGPANDPYSFRGGDLEQWRSADDGATWQKVRTLRKADPSMGVVYNDPQIVLGHGATGPRVLFGEWDNDAGNFVHKLFLWGSNGFRSREFFPSLTRLEGADRYTAAVAVSRSAFPNGSDTVVIASGEVHADALAGGPLAAAYHAPLLLVKKGGVPGAVAAEVRRLRAKNVIVLGGLGTITRAAQNALAIGSVRSIRRIAGADRYAVAASVAAVLAAVSGPSDVAFIVSGTAWADALSAASVAAVRGAPVLLVKATGIPGPTAQALATLGTARTVVVGGPATVSDRVLRALPRSVRISGKDRYAVSAAVAEAALDGTSGLTRSIRTDRITIASGEVFPDALVGAVFAARARGPMLLTRGRGLSAPTSSFLRRRAVRVLDCFVLGGTGTLRLATASAIADALRERQAD